MSNRIICLDFDGVLANYTEWKGEEVLGDANPEGVQLANMLYNNGFHVIVSTCRNNGQWKGIDYRIVNRRIVSWLVKNGLSFCELWFEKGKPFALAYVDDRGVNFPANVGPAVEVFNAIMKLIGD